jgi:hypothetical protein
MFYPNYLIRLKKQHFDDKSQAVCLGPQLLQILNCIEQSLSLCFWYGADMDSTFFTEDTDMLNFTDYLLKKIGDIAQLKKLVSQIDQFLSGVFIAISKDVLIVDNTIDLATLDPEFRSLDIEGVMIEIRAFDTSYLEIYSNHYELMKRIANQFHADIVER